MQAVGKLRIVNGLLSLIAFNVHQIELNVVELFLLEAQIAQIYYKRVNYFL